MIVECTYCGVNATSLDHIIPVSYEFVSRKVAKYNKDNTVPSCSECNNSLSNLWYPTISERAGYLIEKYTNKYDRLLSQPIWEDWELDEMQGNLKKMIVSNIEKKKLIETRLEHLLGIFNQTNLTPEDIWDKYPPGIFTKFKSH